MSPRSRSLRRGVHALAVGGIVALGSTFGLVGPPTLRAQPPDQGAKPKEAPTAPPSPEARLRAQRLRTRLARVSYEIARLNRELAEIGVEQYREESYSPDLSTIDGEIKIAESDLTRARDRLDWARRMFDKGYVSRAQLGSEETNFQKAQFSLEQARAKKLVITKYTGPKTIKAMEVDVDRARNEELDRKAAWKHEEAREADLEREIGRK